MDTITYIDYSNDLSIIIDKLTSIEEILLSIEEILQHFGGIFMFSLALAVTIAIVMVLYRVLKIFI